MSSRFQGLLVNGLLALGSLTLSLVVVELVLAFHDRRPNPRQLAQEFVLGGTPYTLFETADALVHSGSAVLIAGDSFTAGAACGLDRDYPSAFTRAARAMGTEWHAVNLGMPATGPLTYLGRVKGYLEDKGTAAGVVITLYVNDVEVNCVDCVHLPLLADADTQSSDAARLRGLCNRCSSPGKQTWGDNDVRRIHRFFATRSRSYRLFQESAVRFALATGWIKVGWGRTLFPTLWSDLGSTSSGHSFGFSGKSSARLTVSSSR